MIADAEPRAARSLRIQAGLSSLQARSLPGICTIPRDTWTALFPGEAEGWDYYAAL